MKDFTHDAYKEYLEIIKLNYSNILRFDEYFLSDPKPDSFCIIRHDVDRKPENALKLAKLEKTMEIQSTYYFRAKRHTFITEIISEIADYGHEIGYHYENLSDTNGNVELALENFKKNLMLFRDIYPVKTCAMHGRPFKPFNNIDLWKISNNHNLLLNDHGIVGDVFLDIDYTDIAYINDTGRNWSSTKSNVRDKVNSLVNVDFKNRTDLLEYLSTNHHSKMVFQIHPERWSSNSYDYYIQYCKDALINIAKSIISIDS